MKQFSVLLLLLLLSMNIYSLGAQTGGRPLSVGIFIYPGVEILDFSGPSEVFGSTEGFNTFTVAFTKEPLVSQGFVTVTPQYSIDDCPPTDILVFPGGNSGSVGEEAKLIDWIRERSNTTQFMMSVCTGAALLSRAGLLNGLEVTTWHGFIPGLQALAPQATVLSDTRFVDNGHIVTTAGVSAGIDGALHMVSRIYGESAARATARYMEYDKWQPKEGKVHETPFVKTVRTEGLDAARKKFPPTTGSLQPAFYPGEMINLAAEETDARPAESEAILKWLIATTPPTPSLYNALGAFYRKTGKFSPPDSHVFLEKLSRGEVAWARKTYRETLEKYPDWKFFTEEDLNVIGYQLAGSNNMEAALDVLKWNTELYPRSANAWDSLAEHCETAGKNEQALHASEQCLANLPGAYGQGLKDALTKSSNERIARLKSKK